MSKLWIVIGIGIMAGLLWTGVVDVNFNKPDNYTDISGLANTVIKEKGTYEKGRAYIVGLKRKVELLVVRDREKRLVLSLLYVKTDAARLQELVEANSSANTFLPQAELLVASLEQVRSNAEKAPVEVVARMKDDSTKAFASAQQALGGLQEQHEEYTNIHSEFTRLTGSLEEQIGQLGLEEIEPAVAGSQDEKDKVDDDSADIPLKF